MKTPLLTSMYRYIPRWVDGSTSGRTAFIPQFMSHDDILNSPEYKSGYNSDFYDCLESQNMKDLYRSCGVIYFYPKTFAKLCFINCKTEYEQEADFYVCEKEKAMGKKHVIKLKDVEQFAQNEIKNPHKTTHTRMTSNLEDLEVRNKTEIANLHQYN